MGVSVIPSLAKLLSSILKEKFEQNMANSSEEQSGFVAGRSGLDNVHCPRLTVKKNREIHVT